MDGFFFALLALLRNHVHLGPVDRPLFIGLILAVFSNNPVDIIATALALELFWLDVIPVGTVIPPDRLLPLLLTALCARVFDLHGAGEFLTPLLIFSVCGGLGAWLTGWVRKRQNAAHAQLQDWASRGDERDLPALLMLRGTVLFFACQTALFFGVFVLSLIAARLWFLHIGEALVPDIPGISWPWLILAAGIGGILSLRLKKARFLFSCVFASLVCLLVISNA